MSSVVIIHLPLPIVCINIHSLQTLHVVPLSQYKHVQFTPHSVSPTSDHYRGRRQTNDYHHLAVTRHIPIGQNKRDDTKPYPSQHAGTHLTDISRRPLDANPARGYVPSNYPRRD